jgi:hypothetical protein
VNFLVFNIFFRCHVLLHEIYYLLNCRPVAIKHFNRALGHRRITYWSS